MVQYIMNQLVNGVPLLFRFKRPSFDTRHVKQIPHQAIEPISFMFDSQGKTPACFLIPLYIFLKQAAGGSFN